MWLEFVGQWDLTPLVFTLLSVEQYLCLRENENILWCHMVTKLKNWFIQWKFPWAFVLSECKVLPGLSRVMEGSQCGQPRECTSQISRHGECDKLTIPASVL